MGAIPRPGFGIGIRFSRAHTPAQICRAGGEGVLFTTPDSRARLRVFGFHNKANHTPRSYLRRSANFRQARFTYIRTTRRFFVASGTHDEMIFYRRCNFFRGTRVGCLQLDYPVQEKSAWDDIVTRISLSLAAVQPKAAQVDSKAVPFEVDAGNEKVAALPSYQLDYKADPMIEKAKTTIAAMLENPALAEFGRLKRAVKDLRGERLDTICGYVKGKSASGVDTGEVPFLYIVQDNAAYLVDGRNLTAETVHRVLCN